ncbi:ABC transporter ATP-binding protein [Methanobrevibacter olleyae]|uniref:Peptide/nickel ABC transporter ATP-binding protein n=1 Tax=Methanobrevibacter olleyae TaxID=294671 RepID=A0A126R0Q3_METOL|nr:ATP-binding cassette domain-containing protein [Methanobrevibacter olleyae]AMK15644.1 peptide/nickel ABC transporter ATP-binding protein [Methanobrevibacter olleyae]
MELTGKNISFKYSSQSKQILKDVNITIDNKKILGLFGDSGSGKSSLCKILAGHIKRYEGEVKCGGNKIPNAFDPVQLIYQHPEKVMNPKWKMHEVLGESWDVPDDLLEDFGIQKSWLNRWPAELSGGELQRFSVLRALNPKTKFLIADEMTTMLDAITQVQIFDSVLKIVKERNMGLLVVSHDKDLMDIICDEVVYIDDINHV